MMHAHFKACALFHQSVYGCAKLKVYAQTTLSTQLQPSIPTYIQQQKIHCLSLIRERLNLPAKIGAARSTSKPTTSVNMLL